jgi:ribosomal protein L16 Arg81 hydroxylase
MDTFDAWRLSRRLIGEMAIQDFNCDVRERRVAKYDAAIDPEVLSELYSLSRLESAFAREEIPTLNVDVFTAGQLAKLVDVQHKSGKSSLTVVADQLRLGATIRVRDVQKFDARLNRFAGEIQRFFAAQSQINVYLTPPARKGFAPHFDITDVFIVQCVGRKEWKIFHDYADKMELPLPDTPWDPERYKPSAPAEAMTLRPGDVLYLPRGAMHQAFCTDRESMHLTISMVPVTFADLLARELRRIAGSDIELRRRVPWTTSSGDSELNELTTQVRERVIALADQIDVGAQLRAEQRSFQMDPEAASMGVLESAIASLAESTGTD